jgi:hypothetical protein
MPENHGSPDRSGKPTKKGTRWRALVKLDYEIDNYAPMPSSKEPAASGKQRLSRTYWMPLVLVASRSR